MRISAKSFNRVITAVSRRADKLNLDFPIEVYVDVAIIICGSRFQPCSHIKNMSSNELAGLCLCLDDKIITVNPLKFVTVGDTVYIND